MLKRRFFTGIWLLALLTLAASCSDFRKVQKSTDWKEKYDAAIKYYEDKDYYRSSILLEEILPVIRGRPEAEKAQFYFAYAYYYQKQYILSAHYFETFFKTYSRSQYAEEAQYMYAYSLFLESPEHNLDQSSTQEAIQAMQAFLNKFQVSKFREEGNAIIDALQEKLEEKGYENAKQYHKLGRYKASLIAFDNFKKDFPDSDLIQEVSFLEVEAQYLLAEASVPSKKKERYQKAVQLYLEFIDFYDENNEYLRQAQRYYENSLERIED
ncbi:MAG: outer membrane protein assembly factor BamD, partial [Cyanobacteria bacterium P01_H01_bin.74]